MHFYSISNDQHFLFTLCTDELAIKEVERITFVRLKSYLSETVKSLYRFLDTYLKNLFSTAHAPKTYPFVIDTIL